MKQSFKFMLGVLHLLSHNFQHLFFPGRLWAPLLLSPRVSASRLQTKMINKQLYHVNDWVTIAMHWSGGRE